ncbi:protein NEGATIVE GRAVITROPIC RESPONSE OF ROOTS-like [Rhodamnia argentea]|uniref:Protein NEGATIVE GRAVITROPIC RESPONSE OF ROOTS-like n=1 Tax=Rhodamnia argentea TaxID=178133 RepID=A0A8B8P6R0_9MYRT|nr:protein NEGATIVE GRAVITROPIC RESPONSE OF ROOTS-like [Rhodamnia argentea]
MGCYSHKLYVLLTKILFQQNLYEHLDLHTPREPCKDEFGDWPNGLLTIGTFGNGSQSKDQARQDQQDHTTPSPSHDQSPQDLTIEQVWKLQQELNSFLNTQPQRRDPSSDATGNSGSSGSYRSASCPLSSEIVTDMREIAELISHKQNTREDNFQETNSAVVYRKSGKDDVVSDGAKRNGIGKRSLSLLMKKMLACKSGFNLELSTVPSFRDPLPETRMEKVMKAILHKKVYPQSSSQALSAKRCLEQRPMPKSSSNQEQANEEAVKSKWDRTDSEYIVLEI